MIGTRRPQVFLPRKELYIPNSGGSTALAVAAWTNASALAANRAYYVPFSAPFDTAVTALSVYCAAQSGQNFDFGLYDASGNRLVSRGSTAISATGVRTWTLTTPWTVTADTTYYAAFGANSATPTFTVTPAANTRSLQSGTLVQDTAFALPSTWTTPTNTSGIIPLIRVDFSG